MTVPWSAEARVLVRPYRTFAALADEAVEPASGRVVRPAWLAVRRPLLFLLVGASFVSLSASGRFVVGHLFWAMLSLSFLVALHVASLTATTLIFGRRPLARSIDLYFVARAPWYVLLLGLGAWLALFVATPVTIFGFFLGGTMPVVLIATMLWSCVLDHAFYRRGLGYGAGRATAAMAVGLVLYLGLGVVWYLATEQLLPLLSAAPT